MASLAAYRANQSYLYQRYSHQPRVTVFCDFDGPIVDVSDRYYNTYKLGLAEVQAGYAAEGEMLPLHVLTKAQFWSMKQERLPDPEIAMRSGLRGQQIELFLQRVTQIVNRPELLHQDRLQPGVKWALTLLHTQGIRLALVTLRRQNQAIEILQQHGLYHLFNQIHGAEDDQAAYRNQAEHKAQLLEAAIEQSIAESCLPLDSQNAWMIGDTEADVLAGQTLGIQTIALTCGIRSRNYLQRFEPTHVQADLLSAVNYLIRSACLAA